MSRKLSLLKYTLKNITLGEYINFFGVSTEVVALGVLDLIVTIKFIKVFYSDNYFLTGRNNNN